MCFVVKIMQCFFKLCAEFSRVCGTDLLKTFFETLDRHSEVLLTILSTRSGVHGPLIAEELNNMRAKVVFFNSL